MKITRDNYESFFLDYLEGNLEENLIDQFLDFLEQNPDLKEELQLFENIRLPEEPVSFEGKKQLYKLPAQEKEAFERKSIAWMEGDLKEEERRSFEAYLAQHPGLKKEAAQMQSTRLVADTSIHYPNKHQLYKTSGTMVMMNWLGRAAAILVLGWGISTFFESEQPGINTLRPKEVAVVKAPSAPSPSVEVPVAPESRKAEQKKEIFASKNADAAKVTPQKAERMALDAAERAAVNDTKVMSEGSQKSADDPLPAPAHGAGSMEEIPLLMASLEQEPATADLAVSRTYDDKKTHQPDNVITVEEYLAQRAKKATDEGLLSAHRLLRMGLNVASGLSGERIGYRVKKGKVTTVEFESKLLAFSIPLEKKQ